MMVMAPPSHGRRSTNWNSAELASKRQIRTNEIANVIKVVHKATQRALRSTAASSPRNVIMNSAPTSGRNTVTDRIGQLISNRSRT